MASQERQNSRLFFAFQLGMPFFDHASQAMSREAKRLDMAWWRGTLLPAGLKSWFPSYVLKFSSCFKLVVLGLDIESLSSAYLDISQAFLTLTKSVFGNLTEGLTVFELKGGKWT
jgi:hypothetical protein